MLKITNLSKSYESLKAVDDVSFDIAAGEIFGFLGPNGAGKTTTITMIAGLLKSDVGRIRIDGMDHGCFPQVDLFWKRIFFRPASCCRSRCNDLGFPYFSCQFF